MRLYPGDFAFQLGNAQVKFIQRIAVEAFVANQACCILAGAACGERAFIILHCNAASDGLRLLSTPCTSRQVTS